MAFGGGYHKIDSVFKRDMDGDRGLIQGEFSRPEFNTLKNNEWICTEKVDGTNVRVIWDGNSVQFKGRTDKAELPTDLLVTLKALFPAESLSMFFDTKEVCLYGEGYGKKIQEPTGSLYNYHTQNFILFDIRIGQYWLDYASKQSIATALGVQIVPVVFRGSLLNAIKFVKKGFLSKLGENPQAEGLIATPEMDLRCRNGNRIITKLKTKDFV